MYISGFGMNNSLYSNPFEYNTDETQMSKSVKEINNEADRLNSSNSAVRARINISAENKQTVQNKNDKEDNLKGASVKLSYGEGQPIPNHTVIPTDTTDFTFDFSKNNEFSLVGATNKIEDVNIEKELSDMKKDTALDQYKYFVNPTKLGSDMDGTVRLVGWQ